VRQFTKCGLRQKYGMKVIVHAAIMQLETRNSIHPDNCMGNSTVPETIATTYPSTTSNVRHECAGASFVCCWLLPACCQVSTHCHLTEIPLVCHTQRLLQPAYIGSFVRFNFVWGNWGDACLLPSDASSMHASESSIIGLADLADR
jgi:hypothetical protein